MSTFTRVPGEVRQATLAVLELVDEGVLDARQALAAALGWMSDDDVEEMATENAFLEYEDDEYDDSSFDAFDDGQALASAGWGTDEDYGSYGDEY